MFMCKYWHMGDKYKAVLVEDDSNWVKFFKEVVVHSNQNKLFEFVYAEDLKTATAMLKQHNDIVLVLLDLMLPDSQAEETVVWGSMLHAPVVIMTTLADDKLMHLALQHNIEDYLLKDEYDDTLFFHVASRAVSRFVAKLTIGLDEMSIRYQELSKKLKKLVP